MCTSSMSHHRPLLLEPLLHYSFITPGFRLKNHSNSGIIQNLLPEGYPLALPFKNDEQLHSCFSDGKEGHLDSTLTLVHARSSSTDPYGFVSSVSVCISTSKGEWERSMFAICETLKRPTSAHLLNSLQPASECHYGSFLLLALCPLWYVLVQRRRLILYLFLKAVNHPSENLKLDSGFITARL